MTPQHDEARAREILAEEMIKMAGKGAVDIQDIAVAAMHRFRSESPVPTGWRLVPVEPTGEMLDAAAEYLEASRKPNAAPATVGYAYRAMIQAAPNPPGDNK